MGSKEVSTFGPTRPECEELGLWSAAKSHFRVLQVWTASLDGTLRLWDFLEGTELKSYDLGDAIVSLACTPCTL